MRSLLTISLPSLVGLAIFGSGCAGEDYPNWYTGGSTGAPQTEGGTTSLGGSSNGGTSSLGGTSSGGSSSGGASLGGTSGRGGGGPGGGGKGGGGGRGGSTGRGGTTGFGQGGAANPFARGGTTGTAGGGGAGAISMEFRTVATSLGTTCGRAGCHAAGGVMPNLTNTDMNALYTTLTTYQVCGAALVVPMNATTSGLLSITSTAGCDGKKMPPSGPGLSATARQSITTWITNGAKK